MSCCESCAGHENQSAKLGMMPYECLSDPAFSFCAGGGVMNLERGTLQDFYGYGERNAASPYVRHRDPAILGPPQPLIDNENINSNGNFQSAYQAPATSQASFVVPALLVLSALWFLRK